MEANNKLVFQRGKQKNTKNVSVCRYQIWTDAGLNGMRQECSVTCCCGVGWDRGWHGIFKQQGSICLVEFNSYTLFYWLESNLNFRRRQWSGFILVFTSLIFSAFYKANIIKATYSQLIKYQQYWMQGFSNWWSQMRGNQTEPCNSMTELMYSEVMNRYNSLN